MPTSTPERRVPQEVQLSHFKDREALFHKDRRKLQPSALVPSCQGQRKENK